MQRKSTEGRTRKRKIYELDDKAMIIRLLTVQQVAMLMKVSPKTVRAWIHNGELRVMGRGRLLRVPEDGLIDFIKHNTK